MTGLKNRPPTDLLVIEVDERRKNEFQVNLRKPVSNWKKALLEHSTFQTLSITESNSSLDGDAPVPATAAGGIVAAAAAAEPSRPVVDAEQVIMQLSVALHSHHDGITTISKIEFSDCQVAELGMLCMAVMNQPTTTKTATPTTMSTQLSLSFKSAIFDSRAVKALCCLLEDNSLEHLCLEECIIDCPSASALKLSLGKNRSLRSFHWCTPEKYEDHTKELVFMNSIQNMVLRNRDNLVELHMSIKHDQSVWNICRAATQRYSSLKRLRLIDSEIPLQLMEPVVMMCMTIDSLQDLCFYRCSLKHRSLKLLEQTLSKHKVLETLAIEDGMALDIHGHEEDIKQSFGNVQVRNLSLQGTQIDEVAVLLMMREIQFNPLIQSLNVSDGLVGDDDDESFQALIEVIQGKNQGLTELVMDGEDCIAKGTMDALQRNSTIQALTIRDRGITDFLPFAQGVLTNMSNLRKLTFQFSEGSEELPEEFFQALAQGMEQNTTLQSLEIRGASVKDELAKQYLPRIRYYLAINRIKRNSLMAESVPSGLWAHVLSKTSKEVDGIYFVLTGKPDIIAAFTTLNRKRKKRNDDDDDEGE